MIQIPAWKISIKNFTDFDWGRHGLYVLTKKHIHEHGQGPDGKWVTGSKEDDQTAIQIYSKDKRDPSPLGNIHLSNNYSKGKGDFFWIYQGKGNGSDRIRYIGWRIQAAVEELVECISKKKEIPKCPTQTYNRQREIHRQECATREKKQIQGEIEDRSRAIMEHEISAMQYCHEAVLKAKQEKITATAPPVKANTITEKQRSKLCAENWSALGIVAKRLSVRPTS